MDKNELFEKDYSQTISNVCNVGAVVMALAFISIYLEVYAFAVLFLIAAVLLLAYLIQLKCQSASGESC
jgi:hypothetical protein